MSRKPGSWSSYSDHISAILDAHKLLDKACEPIVEKTHVKSAGNSIEVDCSSLWDLWTNIVERDFDRTWDIAGTPKLLVKFCGSKDFISQDARFIQVILQSVDPQLTVGTIQYYLKERVAPTKPKSK